MVKLGIGAGLLALVLTAITVMDVRPAGATSAAEIDRNVDAALTNLYASVAEAQQLGKQAKGVLVFPSIVKAGFLFGAQYGEGALRHQGRTLGYYNSVAGSYGLQAGIQKFGYALFFMSDPALRYLEQSQGFEIGSGPSVVILDIAKAKALTTTTLQSDIYAFIFDQKGLMAGFGLQGSKISRIEK
jgi:lipid-binding SYLF domain-containing protein